MKPKAKRYPRKYLARAVQDLNQAMVDAMRETLGLGPLYAADRFMHQGADVDPVYRGIPFHSWGPDNRPRMRAGTM